MRKQSAMSDRLHNSTVIIDTPIEVNLYSQRTLICLYRPIW